MVDSAVVRGLDQIRSTHPLVAIGWGALFYIGKYILQTSAGINHVDGFLPFTLYVASFCLMLLYQYRYLRFKLRDGLDLKGTAALVLLLVVAGLMYRWASPDLSLLKQYPQVHFAYLSNRYLLSKSFDILFQQLALSLYIWTMLIRGIELFRVQIITAATMGLVHLHTFLAMPPVVCTGFVVASFFAGYFWPAILDRYKHGIIYNYISHWIFYLLIGVGFNVYVGSL